MRSIPAVAGALLALLLAAAPAGAKPDLIVNNGGGDCLQPDDCSVYDAVVAMNSGLGKSIAYGPPSLKSPGIAIEERPRTSTTRLSAVPPAAFAAQIQGVAPELRSQG